MNRAVEEFLPVAKSARNVAVDAKMKILFLKTDSRTFEHREAIFHVDLTADVMELYADKVECVALELNCDEELSLLEMLETDL